MLYIRSYPSTKYGLKEYIVPSYIVKQATNKINDKSPQKGVCGSLDNVI